MPEENSLGERFMQILRAAVLSFCAFMMQPAMADDVETTLENFRTAGAGDFIDDAYGYAVFPSIGKGGIGIGGAFQVFCE